MIVISDSTPLISLMKAVRLEILEPLFGEVFIPEAVVSVKEKKAVDILRRTSGLDLGESEAIVYADDNKADVLLMDEARGRQVAKAMGLYIMGTSVVPGQYRRNILDL